MSKSSADSWPRSPVWFRRPEVLHAGTYLVIGLAALVETVVVLIGSGRIVSLPGLAVTVAGAALAWWRPWPGLVVAATGCVLAAALGGDPVVMWSMTVFTLFSFTLRGGPAVRATLVVGVALYAAMVIAALYDFDSVAAFTALFTAMAGGAIGAALRIHQQYWRSLEQRAADAVATRESEATRRVIEERLRIARDLHDVVGHQVAVVSMHLGVAEVHLPGDADPARTALASARTAVRSVLLETQRILTVLRRDTAADGAAQPAPGLSGLPELIDSFRQIGLRVRATLGELPVELDPLVGVTAFRIVQEALTNAHRHGDGTAELEVRTAGGRLLIEVVNERRRDTANGRISGGHGLLGVRERVASAGGALWVIDDDDGPFRLSVALPTDGSDLA